MKKVLLIVDDPEMWEFMSFYLAMQGCKVYRSNKVDEVIETCRSISPDCVVTDSSVSRMTDVTAFYSVLASDPSMAGVKLFTLCDPSSYKRIRSFQRPQDVFITRPVSPKMLLIMVRDLIHNEKPEWIPLLVPRAA